MIQQQVKNEFPTLEDIHAAAERLDGLVVKTPFVFSETISKTLGAEMWLKFENLQFTASFKERGALNKLLSLSEQEKQHGVIAASAGNHAQGVAYHAQRTGVTATIVMPKSTPNVKVQRVREYGARVILHGQDFSEAAAEMHRVAQEESLTIIHPFDDAEIIAGQGTIALEMLEAVPDLDILVVPIGGGGLISGIAIAAKTINPKIKIIGVQSVVYPSMAKLLCNYQLAVSIGSTVAEGIAVKTPGELTTQIAKHFVDDIVVVTEDMIEVVTEDMIEEAIALLLNIEKTVCEGAGATGIAAIMSRPDLFLGHKVGVVLSGGNIDTRVMVSVLQRHLTRTGRMVRIRVELPDNPGALARLTAIIAEQGGNIYELRHERFAATSRAKESAVSVDIELKSAPDLEPLIQAMQLEGYIVRKEEI
ncbi:threonine ammonia-lyase [Acinetobacter baumannii]